MSPHLHISGAAALVDFLYLLVGLAVLRILSAAPWVPENIKAAFGALVG